MKLESEPENVTEKCLSWRKYCPKNLIMRNNISVILISVYVTVQPEGTQPEGQTLYNRFKILCLYY